MTEPQRFRLNPGEKRMINLRHTERMAGRVHYLTSGPRAYESQRTVHTDTSSAPTTTSESFC